MRRIGFDRLHAERKIFLKENCNKDYVVLEGRNNVLLSAPHGVSQVRLGKFKFSEIGSLAMALQLKRNTDCHMIAKTKNNCDDANFDENCEYRLALRDYVRKNNIKYIIDIHGLDSKRECDVNLGIHLGKNIEKDEAAFQRLEKLLRQENFAVAVDQPFMGGNKTIAGGMKNEVPDLWTIQIEINCAITNKRENIEKFNRLLGIFLCWIESITKRAF